MKKLIVLSCALVGAVAFGGVRWSVEKAQAWGAKTPWRCGVNYIPSNAINYTEMWDKTSFSPDLIRRELALMKKIGLNTVRVFLQYLVYEDDPAYCERTFRTFLDICEENGIKVMPCFFDDCTFSPQTEPHLGKQDDPVIGWYSWAWTPSPGPRRVKDVQQHAKLERYVKGMLTAFKDDPRVLAWDLYNEPTNTKDGHSPSFELLKKTFAWARSVDPSQPLTTGVWNGNKPLNEFLLAESDIVTFHCYSGVQGTRARIEGLKKQAAGRPLICTEWMNRPSGSTVRTCLSLYADENVGCVAWGLVNGKTQTHLRWGYRPEKLPYTGPWQHDFFHNDFTPYDSGELEILKTTLMLKTKAMKNVTLCPVLDPCAKAWAWTVTAPSGDWTASTFDDAAWARSAGGFGNAAIVRDVKGTKVATSWTTSNLWLRRHFNYAEGTNVRAVFLDIHYDESPEIWLNGKKIFAANGFSAGYIRQFLPLADFLSAVKPGDNVLAVKMTQTAGGQYFDLGLSFATDK